ncbi:MAG: sulfatase-like hydrolase/transferase [Comamonadaceae bacterium]|jgi:arylsulfatase A-like enzyme|nr:sulfatase-like hydrolase/transferase [Comamonadaceae bacterium]
MTHFVFIVADDLGCTDQRCFGARSDAASPALPVLDGLAARALRYVNGYANSPACTATRFALMTGRYQYGVCGNPDIGLHPHLPTLLDIPTR